MQMDVINFDGKKVGDVTLSDAVFGQPKRTDLLARVVNWQLAKARQGSANTQVRSEVSRTSAKWYRQKGTGRARHGDRKANIFVGGAAQFGPRPKSWAFNLNKKVRQLALRTALSTKKSEDNLIVLDAAALATHKTKDLASKLSNLSLQNAIFVVDALDENFDKASRNLPHIKVIPTEGLNVYDILHKDKLVLTQNAVTMLESRLGQNVKASAAETSPEAAPEAAPAKGKSTASKASSSAKKTASKASTASKTTKTAKTTKAKTAKEAVNEKEAD